MCVLLVRSYVAVSVAASPSALSLPMLLNLVGRWEVAMMLTKVNTAREGSGR